VASIERVDDGAALLLDLSRAGTTALGFRDADGRAHGFALSHFPIPKAPRQTPGLRCRDRYNASARGFANEGSPHSLPAIMRDQAGDADSIQERVADRVEAPGLEREINGHFGFQFVGFRINCTLR
jgi:hypothetical protein